VNPTASSFENAQLIPAVPGRVRRFASAVLEQGGMLLVLALLFLGCAIFVPNFLSWENQKGMMLSVSTVGMVACTMLFCLASGNFDLSVGTIVPCSGVVAALVTAKTGHYSAGVAAGLAVGAVVGLLNGSVVAWLRINPLITTLATMQMVKGFTFIVSGGRAVGVADESFSVLGGARVLGIQSPVWLAAICFVLFGLLLARTTFGRNTLAIGGNEEAARLAGVPVVRTKIIIFLVQGLMAAFAGIVLASRMTSGQPKSSEGFELEVIAACVLGGVSLTGGVGRMGFVIAGVLIMGIVQNAMNLLNIDSFYQYVVRGAILLTAVLFDRLRLRR
jgi:L-arabinose transport system permease protein